jgi:Cu(I)/Ag(I) efflux system membrane fusion protein
MTSTPYKFIGIVVVLVVFAATSGYWFARHKASHSEASMPANGDRQVLFWYDPMVPNQHFDQPGKSPFMDMQLVPKYAGDAGDEASLRIDPAIVQNLGVRTTTVERGAFSRPIDAVGNITFNQRNVAIVQARTNGFVARVYARAPGDVLKRGAPLVDLLVPEWVGGQTEFLALVQSGDRALIDAARERLVLLGMPPDLITRIEATRKPETTIIIRTPRAGAIESFDAREGMTVSAGATLAKIDGLESVWLEAAIPETEGGLANIGKSVDATLTTYPGETFKGEVIDILPEANSETRTLRARIELKNPDGKLRPGMFARVRLDAGDPEPLLYVASEAVIRTGTRNIVLVADDRGRFTPATVAVGAEADGKTVIVRGVNEGQKVVASGQFLIDSEASLKGILARLGTTTEPKDAMTASVTMHEATGKVESISAEKIVISHGPVQSLNWPAMTMGFNLPRPDAAANLKPGDTVNFRFRQAGGDFIVEQLEKAGSAP